MQHLIRYFDNPLSQTRKEIEHEFSRSFDEAFGRAAARARHLSVEHGPATGFIIEDLSGRQVMIGPGREPDAQGS